MTLSERRRGLLMRKVPKTAYDETEAYQKSVPTGGHYASVEKIGGKTVVWNEQVTNGNFEDATGWSKYSNHTLTVADNVATLTVNSTNCRQGIYRTVPDYIVGHKYFLSADYKASTATNYGGTDQYVRAGTGNYDDTGTDFGYLKISAVDTWLTGTFFITIDTAPDDNRLYLGTNKSSARMPSGNTLAFRNVYLADLTQMFGSGNEPTALTDERIAFIRAYATANPAYNSGELVSGKCDKVTYTDTESVSTDYSISATTQALEGYGYSAGTAYNYVDFERKKFVKCVGAVDLGTLSWSWLSNYSWWQAVVPTPKRPANANTLGNVLNADFLAHTYSYLSGSGTTGVALRHDNNMMVVKNGSSTDRPTGTAYYELATPVETDITDTVFDEPFAVEVGGTLTMHQQDDTRLPLNSTEKYTIIQD